MEFFSALFLSCVFHMLWRAMLDFSPTAGKPVSHLLCESWSHRGNGGKTEEFFIRAFDQDDVDFFLWRNNKFPWKLPSNRRSSQRWISQQDKSSSLELPETIGRWPKHTSVTTIWVPSLSFDISFLIGEVAPGCRRTERFLIPYMPSTTPGLCLAMSKWANELTIFPTKWRAKWETRYWVGMEHHPVTVFMYLPARERSHLPPKREESSSSKVFFGGMWDRFLGGFL